MALLSRTSIGWAAIITIFSVAYAYLSQVPLGGPVDAEFDFPQVLDDSCTVNKVGAFDVVEGSNQFSTSPTNHINSVKIKPSVNQTNWEQWMFDSLSHTGLSYFTAMFTRDNAYHFLGKGTLRMEFYMTLPDGTVIQELDYSQESTIIDCSGYVAGIWNGSDSSYSFHVTKDLKHAKVKLDSWRVRGTYKLSSTTPAAHADGSAYDPQGGNEKSTELSPGMFYSVPTAGGQVEVNLTTRSGRKLAFTGRGGSTRLWGSDEWIKITETWLAIRAWAGPYTFTYWGVLSRWGKGRGLEYFSGHLFYNDELILGTQVGNVSETDDYVHATTDFDGEVKGKYLDKNTGHAFEFGSPSQGKKWRFKNEHIVTQYQMGVGKGFGMTAFADRVTGGEVGGAQYEGRGQAEQGSFPEHIPNWVVWIMYGAGLLGTGKDIVFKFAAFLFH